MKGVKKDRLTLSREAGFLPEERWSSVSPLLNFPRAAHLEKQSNAIFPALNDETIRAAVNGNIPVLFSHGFQVGYQFGDGHRNTR